MGWPVPTPRPTFAGVFDLTDPKGMRDTVRIDDGELDVPTVVVAGSLDRLDRFAVCFLR